MLILFLLYDKTCDTCKAQQSGEDKGTRAEIYAIVIQLHRRREVKTVANYVHHYQ